MAIFIDYEKTDVTIKRAHEYYLIEELTSGNYNWRSEALQLMVYTEGGEYSDLYWR